MLNGRRKIVIPEALTVGSLFGAASSPAAKNNENNEQYDNNPSTDTDHDDDCL